MRPTSSVANDLCRDIWRRYQGQISPGYPQNHGALLRLPIVAGEGGGPSGPCRSRGGHPDEDAERLNDLVLPVVKGMGPERAYELLAQSLTPTGNLMELPEGAF